MATNGIISWPGVQNLGYRLTVPSVLLERDQILRRYRGFATRQTP